MSLDSLFFNIYYLVKCQQASDIPYQEYFKIQFVQATVMPSCHSEASITHHC